MTPDHQERVGKQRAGSTAPNGWQVFQPNESMERHSVVTRRAKKPLVRASVAMIRSRSTPLLFPLYAMELVRRLSTSVDTLAITARGRPSWCLLGARERTPKSRRKRGFVGPTLATHRINQRAGCLNEERVGMNPLCLLCFPARRTICIGCGERRRYRQRRAVRTRSCKIR